jgi:hypothetical protein
MKNQKFHFVNAAPLRCFMGIATIVIMIVCLQVSVACAPKKQVTKASAQASGSLSARQVDSLFCVASQKLDFQTSQIYMLNSQFTGDQSEDIDEYITVENWTFGQVMDSLGRILPQIVPTNYSKKNVERGVLKTSNMTASEAHIAQSSATFTLQQVDSVVSARVTELFTQFTRSQQAQTFSKSGLAWWQQVLVSVGAAVLLAAAIFILIIFIRKK